MRKYQKTSGYWVYVHTTPNGMYYIGMSKRQPYFRWRKSKYEDTILEQYISKYGWENIQHKVLVDGLTKKEAEQLEDRLIVTLSMNDLCINEKRSGGIARDNKQAYNKQYREDRKEEMQVYDKQRRSTHEGKIYNRVTAYNQRHTPIETPMMAKLNYIMLGIVPWYIKNDDLS